MHTRNWCMVMDYRYPRIPLWGQIGPLSHRTTSIPPLPQHKKSTGGACWDRDATGAEGASPCAPQASSGRRSIRDLLPWYESCSRRWTALRFTPRSVTQYTLKTRRLDGPFRPSSSRNPLCGTPSRGAGDWPRVTALMTSLVGRKFKRKDENFNTSTCASISKYVCNRTRPLVWVDPIQQRRRAHDAPINHHSDGEYLISHRWEFV